MTLHYRLRTLLILLALLPPLLWIGWGKYQAWKAEQERQRMLREIPDGGTVTLYSGVPQSIKVPDAGTVLLGGLRRDSSNLEHGKGP